jgi:hypothetical protein
VLDDGRVVGIGTHDELLETNETYREIVYSQLSERRRGMSARAQRRGAPGAPPGRPAGPPGPARPRPRPPGAPRRAAG